MSFWQRFRRRRPIASQVIFEPTFVEPMVVVEPPLIVEPPIVVAPLVVDPLPFVAAEVAVDLVEAAVEPPVFVPEPAPFDPGFSGGFDQSGFDPGGFDSGGFDSGGMDMSGDSDF